MMGHTVAVYSCLFCFGCISRNRLIARAWFRALAETLAMWSFISSLVSRRTPRIFACGCGHISVPLKRRGVVSSCRRLREKWISPVLLASKVVSLSLAHLSALRITSRYKR